MNTEWNFAIVALTKRCNLQCSACDLWKATDTIDVEQYLQYGVDKLHEAGFNIIQYTGGEPTFVKGLDAILVASKKRGMLTQLMTNGTNKSRIFWENIAPYLDMVCISVDSYDTEISSKYRGFRDINASIGELTSILHDLNVSMCSTTLLARHNIHEIEKVVAFVNDELGIYFSVCTPQIAENYPLGMITNAFPTKQELITGFEKLITLKNQGYRIINSTAHMRNTIKWLRGEAVDYECKAGKNIVYVDSNSDVYPCFILNKITPLAGFNKSHLRSHNCNLCSFGCFREPSIFYTWKGKLALVLGYRHMIFDYLRKQRVLPI